MEGWKSPISTRPLDKGKPNSLLEASEFVATLEKRKGIEIACPEEIAFGMGFIDERQLDASVKRLGKFDYASYLRAVATEAI